MVSAVYLNPLTADLSVPRRGTAYPAILIGL